jgi:predicted ATPase
MAADGPAVLVWEDLHWADPTTLDFLSGFFARARERRLLSIGTTRPDGEAQWRDRPEVTLLTLGRLTREDIEALVLDVTGGREVPAEILREIVTKTDGVPLFVEELTKSVLESDLLVEEGGRLVLRASRTALGVPITLKDSLTSRLDRLADVKGVAQLAAAIGRTFSSDLLAAVGELEPTDVARAIARLVTAGLVLPPSTPDGTYSFKHALIRDAAYESLLLSSKHAIHERIAEAIEARFPTLAESQPELLAQHLTQAGKDERAIGHWAAAGQRAAERSDNAEAVAHTSAGLALVEKMPEGRERDERELALQIRRAGALRATKGFAAPETGAAYTRARELCHRLNEDELLVPTLNGLYSFHLVRGEYAQAGVTAREILARAERRGDVVHQMIGHRAVGAVLLHTGHPAEAREHLEKALAAYDADTHRALAYTHGTDHAATTSCFLSLALWALGEEGEAEAVQARAIAYCEKIGHAHSLTQALAFDCIRRTVAGNLDGVAERAERMLELSLAHWFPLFTAAARFWLATAQKPRTQATLQEMHRATEAWWGTGAVGYRPCIEAFMAEAHADLGDLAGAMALIDSAEGHQAESDERWTEPELLRVKARLLAALSNEADARRCLEEAAGVARAQGAKVREKRLRAAGP